MCPPEAFLSDSGYLRFHTITEALEFLLTHRVFFIWEWGLQGAEELMKIILLTISAI